MRSVAVSLDPAIERRLRERANQVGQSLESYLGWLAEKDVYNAATFTEATEEERRYISDPMPSEDEIAQLLDNLASGPSLPILPPDFSRANIYDDHD